MHSNIGARVCAWLCISFYTFSDFISVRKEIVAMTFVNLSAFFSVIVASVVVVARLLIFENIIFNTCIHHCHRFAILLFYMQYLEPHICISGGNEVWFFFLCSHDYCYLYHRKCTRICREAIRQSIRLESRRKRDRKRQIINDRTNNCAKQQRRQQQR